MKINYLLSLLIVLICLAIVPPTSAQQVNCGTAEAQEAYFDSRPEARAAWDNFNQIGQAGVSSTAPCVSNYVIPVVFHVFVSGEETTVPLAQVQSALDKANEDFSGLNSDFNTIDPAFDGIKSTMDITFALATKDPQGNATSGVNYYDSACGFGSTDANSTISGYAWDNYMYMNVYIMNDLYCNGVQTNSGVGWYPDLWMSNNGLARVVYNNWYLGDNGSSIADGEFQSVITHEFGHWLNLIHPFDTGCFGFGDGVSDTPMTDGAMGCGPDAFSCGHITNGENYMDYNASCYKMFTEGQIVRMKHTLDNHPTRTPIWQESNLIATGTEQYLQSSEGLPVASFTPVSTTIQEASTVTFNDESCNEPTSWNWIFDGGTPASSTQQSPMITYNTPGIYGVVLVSTNSFGASEAAAGTVTVEAENTTASVDIYFENKVRSWISNGVLYSELENYELYNAMGQLVLNSNQSEVSVEHLPVGVYYIVDRERKIASKALVKL